VVWLALTRFGSCFAVAHGFRQLLPGRTFKAFWKSLRCWSVKPDTILLLNLIVMLILRVRGDAVLKINRTGRIAANCEAFFLIDNALKIRVRSYLGSKASNAGLGQIVGPSPGMRDNGTRSKFIRLYLVDYFRLDHCIFEEISGLRGEVFVGDTLERGAFVGFAGL